MSNRNSLILPKSCLALAVIALSACSTYPIQDDSAIGAVSNTLSKAGTKTRDISISAWDKTIYLLGFSDVNPDAAASDGGINEQMLDEVDLALLEEDAVLPHDFNAPARDIVIVTSPDGLQTPTASPAPFRTPIKISETSWTSTGESEATFQTPTTATAEIEESVQSEMSWSNAENLDDINTASIDEATAVIPQAIAVVTVEDASTSNPYFHEVASSQSLWEIAKSTTGDANNWHTIADVNDLIQSTSVYPGQRLLIPADLVKPELLSARVESESKTPMEAGTDLASTDIENSAPLTLTGAVKGAGENMGVSDAGEDVARLAIPSAAGASEERNLPAMTDDADQNNVQMPLADGESLWDFARRTTGDATNWEQIATHNGMSNEAARLVYPGQLIAIPSNILRTEGSTSNAPKSASNPILEGASDVVSIDKATSDHLARSDAGSEKTALRIVEATYLAEPVVASELESNSGDSPVTDVAVQTTTLEEIIVSGTYYPKAVYHDTNFSSTLLMRVSPGTRLQVSQVEGPWLKVETERGTGYLHQRDIR